MTLTRLIVVASAVDKSVPVMPRVAHPRGSRVACCICLIDLQLATMLTSGRDGALVGTVLALSIATRSGRCLHAGGVREHS